MRSQIRVRDGAALRRAISTARPGTTILLEPGTYEGGLYHVHLHGAPDKPIRIAAANPSQPPRFVGGNNGLQLSQVSYLELDGLEFHKAQYNGLNIDDGGKGDGSSHHITLKNLRISELPAGNHDGIKLSGLDDFRVEGCVIERWGGSGIDMVGCHKGVIESCRLQSGGDSGVQCKGGTSKITVRICRFENAGSRAVNLGGSTGREFFRPTLTAMPPKQCYEAKELTVEGCTFVGGDTPLAFVGVDGARVRFNTIYQPRRWALRILQETRTPDFLPCQKGVLESNLIVFQSSGWSEGGVNIGPGTLPDTFTFRRNFWYCQDRPERSQPRLPTVESGGTYGQDPKLTDALTVSSDSPARTVGADAFTR